MTNGDAATHALAEAFGRVVEESVKRAIQPIEKRLESVEGRLESVEGRLESVEGRLESVESEIREIHELVQIPETLERRALIGQGTGDQA